MPDERVASDDLAILSCPVGEEVGGGPVIGTSVGLQRTPFHAVLGGDLAKVGLNNFGVGATLEESLVGAGAEELLPGGNESFMNTFGGLTG